MLHPIVFPRQAAGRRAVLVPLVAGALLAPAATYAGPEAGGSAGLLAQAVTGEAAEAATAGTVEADASDTSDAEGDADAATAEEEDAPLLPISLDASIGTGFSLGTVFRDDFTTTDSVALRFGLGAGYDFWDDRLSASLSLGYSKNVTPTGINSRYEGRFSDIGLGLGWGNIYTIPVAEIGIGASLGTSLPVSEISRFEGLITATDLGVSLSRSFGLVSLSYSLGVSKNFYRYTSITVNTDRRRDLDLFYRLDGAEAVAENRVALDTGILPEWGVSNGLNLGVRWFETGLSSSIGFSLADSFSFAVDEIMERDEYTSEYAVTGRGPSQSMSGTIGLSYRFLDHFSAGVSLNTGGPPKTSDNRRFRFPFFDTESGNLSYTSLSFRLSASI